MADNVAVTAGSGTTVAADEVVDGTLGTVKVQYVKMMDGTLDGTTKAAVNANGLKVDPQIADASPATQNVTVQDSGSTTSTALANSQSVRTGTPTAGSVADFALSTWETVIVEVTGTWTGTLLIEGSPNSGTRYYQKAVKQIGTSYISNNFTANFAGTVNVAGLTNLAIRSTAAWTGTATVTVRESKSDNGVYVHNGINVQDAVIATNKLTVKSASTAPVATDPAVVVAESPNTLLSTNMAVVAGAVASSVVQGNVKQVNGVTPLMGNGTTGTGSQRVTVASDNTPFPVKIDQTTPGTTNLVSAGQNGTWNVTNVSGTVSLPTGAATAAKQPALGTAGSSSTDVLSVQGIASGTAMPVSAASLPLPALAATSTKQSDGTQKTQIVDGSGNVIGSTSNALNVNISSGSSSGTQYADGAARGTATGTLEMLDDGTNIQSARGDTAGNRYTKITNGTQEADTVAGDSGQNSLIFVPARKEVSFTTTTVQAVASTDCSNYRWVSVQIVTQGGSSTVAFQTSNDNTTWVTQPLMDSVSVGTSAPSVSTTAVRLLSGTIMGRYFRLNVTGIVSGTTAGVCEFFAEAPTGIVSASAVSIQGGVIPGTATTSLGKAEDAAAASGDTGVFALAVRNDALATLTSADGDYSGIAVAASGAVRTDPTGTTSQPVVGAAAHGASVSGSPVLGGGEARATLGTAVATGQAVRGAFNRYGALWVTKMPLAWATSNGTPITATTTSVVAAPAASSHLELGRIFFSNGGSTSTWVAVRDGASGNQYFRVFLPQGGVFALDLTDSGYVPLTSATRLDIVLSAAGSVEYTVGYFTSAD